MTTTTMNSAMAPARVSLPHPSERLDIPLVRSPRQCAKWLEQVVAKIDTRSQRIQAVTALLDSMTGAHAGMPLRIDVLETLRVALIGQASEIFARAGGTPRPYGPVLADEIGLASASLSSLGQAYELVFRAMEEVRAPRRVIPEAVDHMQAILPMARALDADSRQLSGLLMAGVHLDDPAYLSLAERGQALRASTFLDVNLRDPVAQLRPCNARAVFVYPLLLRLADLYECSPSEIQAIDWLARRLAHKVGFRVDEDGRRRRNPYGPSLRVGPGYRVRLDTHRVLASFAADDRELEMELQRSSGAPSCSDRTWKIVFERLRHCWGPQWRRRQVLDAGARRMRIHAGWPSSENGSGVGGRGYDYGRYDSNRVPGRVSRADNGASAFMSEADPAVWVALDEDALWLEQRHSRRELSPGGLVIVQSDVSVSPVAGGLNDRHNDFATLSLSSIVAVQHLLDGHGHRITVRSIDGEFSPVGLGPDGAARLGEAFWSTAPGRLGSPTLVVRKGRLSADERVIVATPHSDLTVRMQRRCHVGADFEVWQAERLGQQEPAAVDGRSSPGRHGK